MAEPPLTRVTLLNRLKDGADVDAWREFVHLYGPVVYGFARKRGLQDADAADLMQEVLRSVARNAERMEYDPKRGTFRLKKLGKGYATVRKQTSGSRPVLRITEAASGADTKAGTARAAKAAKG